MEKDLVYTENNGTQDVYDVQRIAISDFIYAAKEVCGCGPIAYNAWPRIAKPAKMKKYPNNTMMGELQDRLQKLQRSPSNFGRAVKRKIEDLEKMLLIADLQRKLQHQRSVSASLPSSSSMKSLVKKTEAELAAAVLLAPAVEHVPAPAQEAVQDGDRDALPQLAKAGHSPH